MPTTTGRPQSGQWLALGPAEIGGYYALTCNIEALLPSNLIAEGQFGAEQVKLGAISMRFHRERMLRIPNPEEMEDEVWVEKAINDPQSPLYGWQMERALKLAELDEVLEKQQREQQLAALPLAPGYEQALAGGGAALGGVPNAANLTGQPGLGGQPLLPPTPTPPGVPAGMGQGPPAMGDIGIPGGRAAGVGIQPNTQGLPGGVPGGG